MVHRFLKSEKTELEFVALDDRFPKLLLTKPRVVTKTEGELAEIIVSLEPTTMVVEPLVTPFVTVDSVDYSLIFGRDFDTCIFTLTSGNYLAKEAIDVPELGGELNLENNASLFWTSSFEQDSKLYRTDVHPSAEDYSDFVLIAEIDGSRIPGFASTYVDESVVIPPGFSASYMVVNKNGISNILTLSP